jgi:hypothetical protein
VNSAKKIPDEIKKYAEKFPLQIKSSSTDELAEELRKGIAFVRSTFTRNLPIGNILLELPFDILHPEVCDIYVVDKVFDNWEIALNSLGEIYKNFRMERSPDYPMIKSIKHTNDNLPKPVERVSFGLPIPLSDDMVLQSTSHDRRTSPLSFHVAKLAGNPVQYAIVLIWFKSKFLPDKNEKTHQIEKIKLIEKNGTEHTGDLPTNNLIETFLYGPDPVKENGSLSEKGWELIEVSL